MDLKLRKLIFIPVVLFAFSGGVLLWSHFQTGDFILKNVDLKGGALITIESSQPVDVKELETVMDERFGSAFVSGLRTTTGFGATVQVESGTSASEVIAAAEEAGVEVTNFSEETVGPVLGSLFFDQVRTIMIVAFVLMSLVIFLIYRNPVASFGIVFALAGNILATLAFANLLGISLSFAGFAGLLMLIGFTVDTNIVLTSKMSAAGTEGFKERYRRALKTGVTIVATITATMFLVILLSSSKLLINIAEVLVIGFLADLVFTWIFNAWLLQAHFNRKFRHLGGGDSI